MKTVASMHEYINEYVRTRSIEEVGPVLLKEHFGIPFTVDEARTVYFINRVPMGFEEAVDYIKDFFENLDTMAIMELYNKIAV